MNYILNPAKTFAILIGMTEFEGFTPIEPAGRNVDRLAVLLKDERVLGLPSKQIKTIKDEVSSSTKRLLRQYIAEADRLDIKTLILYYAGHGYRRTDGQYFLTAKDSDPELINLDATTCISYENAVKKILKSSSIPQVIVILDACHSGLAAQGSNSTLPQLDIKASYTLTSSAANEESFFDAAHDYTYFTTALIDLLDFGLPEAGERIFLTEMYSALRNTLREKGLKMSPQQGVGKELQPHQYAFCRNRAFDPTSKKLEKFNNRLETLIKALELGIIDFSLEGLKKLNLKVQEELPDSDSRQNLLYRINAQIDFCESYLLNEDTMQKIIQNNTRRPENKGQKEAFEFPIDSVVKLEQCKKRLKKVQDNLHTAAKRGDLRELISGANKLNEARLALLSELLQTVLKGQQRLGMHSDAGYTNKLADLIANDTFKILVIGEFNVGKSTFINALIGKNLLPTSPIPATAITTILRYGENKQARLHFKERGKEPLDIPVGKLSDYVLIQYVTDEEAVKLEIQGNPYSHVEIWWPLELLRQNKGEIIDSPGLNESKVREEITLGYLARVDAVIFLMSAVRFGPAQTEMEIIEVLKSSGHEDVFFVVNQWDMLRPSEQKEVKASALKVLPTLTQRKNGIFFVSALDALDGREENQPELEEKSGFKDFEAELYQFLALEKGKIKILRNARELRRIIRETLTVTIPEKIALLKMAVEEVEKRYNNTQGQLEKLRVGQKDMLGLVERKRNQITGHTESKVKDFFYEVEDRIEVWAKSFDVDKYGYGLKRGLQVKTAINDLIDHIKNKLKEALKEWVKDDLMPYIKDETESLRRDLNRRAARFEEHLQEAHFTLSGIKFDPSNISSEFESISPAFGWKEMLRGLIPNVSAIIDALIIGIPFLPGMLITRAFYVAYSFNKAGGILKTKVAENFRDELRAVRVKQSKEVADNLDYRFSELQEALRAGTNSQITHLKDLVDTAQVDSKKEQGALDRKLTEIEAFKNDLKRTEQELDDFIEEMLTNK